MNARQDEIRFWRDAALGGRGIELVAGRCFEHRYRPHFHEEFVVAVFMSGTHRYRVGRHAGVAVPGDVLLIPQGEMHAGEGASRHQGWSYRAFYPDRETLEELNDELFVGRRVRRVEFHGTPLKRDAELMRELTVRHRTLEQSADPLLRQEAFASAMSALLRRHAHPSSEVRPAAREPRAIGRAVECANALFADSALSVNRLAAAAGLSAYHFMRCFRATTGLTAHQYVLQVRLREARRLLSQDVPACQVACTVGFADQSHLNRHFRTAFGLTPSQYAKATQQRRC